MRLRIRDLLTLLSCLLWMSAGLVLLAVLLPTTQAPSVGELVIVLGCTSLALAFSVVRFDFKNAGQQLTASPDTGFLVLAAVVLDPPWAALVGAVAVLWSIRRAGTLLERAFLAAGGALSTGTASVAAHDIVAGVPQDGMVVVAVAVAAVSRAVVLLTGQLLLAESRTRGGALSVLRGTPVVNILSIEAGLPIAVVSVAGPFLDTPPLALVVVLAGQLLTLRLLGIQHSQHRGSRATDELLRTFHRYVPQHVAAEVLSRDEEHGPIRMDGEQREVTVMFVDIRGFTSWSERVEPAELLAELNGLMGDLAEAVLATDGTLDKFTGDGLMAFWNAPTDQPDHAARALQTVPKLLMRVRECNIRREVQRSTALEIGIGIATGQAVVGNVGHRERLSYTALGDTVNLAARLEKASATLGVPALADERTFLALPSQVQKQLTRLDSIEVKGRAERVRPYAPTALIQHRDGRGAA